jgi:uncharacterized protein (TIGR02421 family)
VLSGLHRALMAVVSIVQRLEDPWGKQMAATTPTRPKVDQVFIEETCQRIKEGRRVRRALPFGGLLFIDRQLPFLCVHRSNPKEEADTSTASLVKGEAAYLLAPGRREFRGESRELLRQLVSAISSEFGGFLLIEIWSGPSHNLPITEPQASRPCFRINIPEDDPEDYSTTHDILRNNLKIIKVLRQQAVVDTGYVKKVSPPGFPPLLSNAVRNASNCHLIGVEVTPTYHNPQTGESYPLVVRRLQRALSHALRRTCYDFTHQHTTLRPAHYHTFGRRTVNKVVFQVDRELSAISTRYDFLLQVTPINPIQAWKSFRRNGFEKPPVFHYRPSPVDPPALKKALYDINIARVEDPALASLFREKRNALDRELTMLSDRGTRSFLYGSMQLFGAVTKELQQAAREILDKTPGRSGLSGRGGSLTPKEFAQRAKAEFAYLREQAEGFCSNVEVTDAVTGLMVSKGHLFVSTESRIPKARAEALIQHEVGTHILTYFNGSQQPFQILAYGLAEYDELQEGLAVLAEYLVGGLSRTRLRLLAGRVVASYAIVDGASFIETFRLLDRTYDFDQRTAYNITMRTYRGGGLVKDAVYFRGLLELMRYIREGGEIIPLLVGKVGRRHVPIIQELKHRHIIKAPAILPRYLREEAALTRLEKVKAGLEPLQLIK